MKKKVLWISLNAPYDKVDHAGGQVHNYYLKQLHSCGYTDIKLITFCHPSELPKLDLDKYGIDATVFPQENTGIKHLFWGVLNLETRYNPWNRYAGITFNFFEVKLKQEINRLCKEGYQPDVVILQWTQMVFFIHYLKKVFPKAKFICIEEDVTFLGYQRKYEVAEKNKALFKLRYNRMKEIELSALQQADQIICSNKKDEVLLKNENLTVPIWSWCPYYNNMIDIKRKCNTRDILFFGAMNREANWKSAIWFIDNVFVNLNNVRFIVLGSKPPRELMTYASNKIIIPGYVDDIFPYFASSMCLVVPLQMGAGIKIKVLEGMSSGIPVLSNSIGIEGIPAKNGFEYLHCENAQDFKKTIKDICDKNIDAETIGKRGKEFLKEKFDFVSDTSKFIDMIINI